jgi:hypothetical protein
MKKIIRKLFAPIALLSLAFGVTISINNQKDVVGAKAATSNFDFSSNAQRTALSTTQQTWVSGDITMVINKNSGSNVADYTNPLRVYKYHSAHFSGNSSVASIESIVVTANNASYATALGNSTFTNATAYVSGAIVTITVTTPTSPVSVALGAQSRWNSMVVNYTPNISGPVLQSISVTTPPTKTTYYEGESFSKSGMVVTASFDSGPSSDVTDDVTVLPLTLTTSTTEVTLSYTIGGVTKETTQAVTVNAVVLNSITIKTNPSKTKFTLGETFSHTGLVINAVYNNGTVEKTSGFTVENVDTMVLGRHNATVSFEGKSATYPVDVTNEGALVGSGTPASDLFISEYYEGASNNKAIEIFNGTSAPINLTDYKIKINANGGTSWGTAITLGSGTLAVGQTYVLANSSSNETIKALANGTSGSLTHNGNDAIGLFKNDVLIDIFGIFNNNVSTGWPLVVDGPVVTVDNAITRNSDVTAPSATWVQSEWTVKGLVTTYLGSHDFDSANATVLEQATAFANYVMTGIGSKGEGQCEAVLTTLQTEYDFMVEDAQLEFETNSDVLFVNARARLAYLNSWVAAQPGSNPTRQSTSDQSRNNLVAVISIGAIGLTSILGYYFVSKKKKLS